MHLLLNIYWVQNQIMPCSNLLVVLAGCIFVHTIRKSSPSVPKNVFLLVIAPTIEATSVSMSRLVIFTSRVNVVFYENIFPFSRSHHATLAPADPPPTSYVPIPTLNPSNPTPAASSGSNGTNDFYGDVQSVSFDAGSPTTDV